MALVLAGRPLVRSQLAPRPAPSKAAVRPWLGSSVRMDTFALDLLGVRQDSASRMPLLCRHAFNKTPRNAVRCPAAIR